MTELRGFKFVTTKYDTFIDTQKQKQLLMKKTLMMYLNQSILQLYQAYKKSLGKGSRWIYDSVIEHISISKHNPLTGSSYIKLPKKLDHPRKGLINIQYIEENECFKWYSQILKSCRSSPSKTYKS